MKNTKNLINFVLHRQQKNIWNNSFIYTVAWGWKQMSFHSNQQVLINKAYLHTYLSLVKKIQYLHICLKTKYPLCLEQYNIYTDTLKQKTFVSRTIQYLHRCLKTEDPLCHLGKEWCHTFYTFHQVSKLRVKAWFSSY